MEENIRQKEIQLKQKAQEIIKIIEQDPASDENNRKIFFLKNFIFNYFGRTNIEDESTKEFFQEEELSSDFVYMQFPNKLTL